VRLIEEGCCKLRGGDTHNERTMQAMGLGKGLPEGGLKCRPGAANLATALVAALQLKVGMRLLRGVAEGGGKGWAEGRLEKRDMRHRRNER
jgi:hypothetical protein